MAHEFKPGDLALIISATNPENLGKVVELIRPSRDREIQIPETGKWTSNPDRILYWVVSGELVGRVSLTGVKGSRTHGAMPATRLMPLKGDEQPAQVRQAERVQ